MYDACDLRYHMVLVVLNIIAIHHFQTLIGFASYNICLLEELPGSKFF